VLMVQGFLVTIWTGGGRFHIRHWSGLTLRASIFGVSHMRVCRRLLASFGGLAPRGRKGF